MPLMHFERRALRFMARHLIVGAIAAALFTGLLLFFDLFGLWGLIKTTGSPVVAVVMLFGGCLVTFGSLAMGAAVMMLGEEDDNHHPPKNFG